MIQVFFLMKKTVNDLFYSVNHELEQSFNNGSLKASEKIFITSSANGKDLNEIFEFNPIFTHGIKATLFYEGFDYENIPNVNPTSLSNSVNINYIGSDLNDHLTTQKELDNPSFLEEIASNLVSINGIIYHVISYFIFLLVVICFILMFYDTIKDRFSNRKFDILLLFCVMLIGTLFVQIFAISWFCSFL